MADPNPPVAVVCALIEQSGRLLVAQRADDKAMGGKWEFPGGKIHPGESEHEAIVREIKEELGCTVLPTDRRFPRTHAYPEFSITLIPIVCEVVEGEPKPLEHAQLRWVGHDELRTLDWAQADVAIVDDLLATRTGRLP